MKININGKANKKLEKIPNKEQQQIRNKLSEIATLSVANEIRHDGKLKGALDRYKIRIGNYRIVFQKISSEQILITAIAHRKDIYNKLFGLTFSL